VFSKFLVEMETAENIEKGSSVSRAGVNRMENAQRSKSGSASLSSSSLSSSSVAKTNATESAGSSKGDPSDRLKLLKQQLKTDSSGSSSGSVSSVSAGRVHRGSRPSCDGGPIVSNQYVDANKSDRFPDNAIVPVKRSSRHSILENVNDISPPEAPSSSAPRRNVAPRPPPLPAELELSEPVQAAESRCAATEVINEEAELILAAVSQKQHTTIIWQCNECLNECIPVRRESRCLCGHRLKEHSMPSSSSSSTAKKLQIPCQVARCPCKHFFFVVAEGAWVLRCRCKHKHIEHDCSARPYKCKKCSTASSCSGFDSPWICNCGHAWGSHSQQLVVRSVADLGAQLQDVYTDEVADEPTATPAGVSNTNPTAKPKNKTFAVRQDGLV
jgi:hypothetical protein